MFDFIPVKYYTLIFFNIMLFIILFEVVNVLSKGVRFNPKYSKLSNKSVVLYLFVLLYMGLRPVSDVFNDMPGYNFTFIQYANGGDIIALKDFYWHVFMKYSSMIMSNHIFFLLCAFLYITPLYIASKKWVGNNMYILFLMFLGSFSFWVAGVNGIRSGIATSFILYAITHKNKIIKYLLILLSYLFHASMIIPITAYVLTSFFNKTKFYLLAWLAAIPLSLFLGNYWENFFVSFGFEDERINYLIEKASEDVFSHTGFRWDFLIYSSIPVMLGYYFIIIRKFNDKVYHQLFNMYLIANAFWILVIRANYSNRFAYLSWFLMSVVVFYPFLKGRFTSNQHQWIAFAMFSYFAFTYFMNVII